jgi:hypothetical protein
VRITLKEHGVILPVPIPPGHYDTINDLLGTIVTQTEEAAKERRKIFIANLKDNNERAKFAQAIEDLKTIHMKIKWTFNPLIKRVGVSFIDRYVKKITVSPHLQYMLGLQFNDTELYGNGMILAKYPVDLRAGIDALYVYCDLLENQIIGNVRAPLLRILPVQGQFGEIIDKDFVAKHYIPVLKKEFQTVHISIKDDTNKPIPFSFGKAVVKLHFKKNEGSIYS